MRLYLDSKTTKKLGYTPDWIKIFYFNEKEEEMELTLDVRGEIDYENDGLDCRVKGELVPWVLYNCETGEEIDLEADEEAAAEFTIERVFELFKNSDGYTLGIYPVDDSTNAWEDDVFTEREGTLEVCIDGEILSHEFRDFEIEVNV